MQYFKYTGFLLASACFSLLHVFTGITDFISSIK